MRAILTILAIWAAGLGAAAQFGKISIAYAALGQAYPAEAGVLIGLMVSIVGIVGLVFGTTAGLVVARIGARRAILTALVLGAGVSVVESFLPPYPLMMLARVLEGVSHLTIVVVGPTAIATVAAPSRQAAAMTLWSTFFGLTYAILAWIGPSILASGGVPGLFRLHALWLLLCAAILWRLMPGDLRPSVVVGEKSFWRQHFEIYASPFVAGPATGFVCYTMTYVAVLTLMPSMMGAWGPFVGVALPLVSIGVSLTLGVWLLGRISAVRSAQAGFVTASVATVLMWVFWEQGVAMVACALFLGASLGIVQGASFASIPQLNRAAQDRARAAGAIAQLGNLGTVSGTPLLAMVIGRAGLTGLVLFVVGFSLLGALIIGLQARRRAAIDLMPA